jgi:membrane dipeptidase
MPPRTPPRRAPIVLDAHADTFLRVLDEGHDFLTDRTHLAVSLHRMRQGGQHGQFFALYVDPALPPAEGAAKLLRMAAAFHETMRRGSDRVALARSAAEVRRVVRSGRVAAILTVEGGHGLEDKPEMLDVLAHLGVSSVTLTHTRTTGWADSSQDTPVWNGLNALGREMIRRMNDLRLLVDVSHASEATVAAVLRASSAPVIASHSCCRALCDHPRNLTDAQIRAIARKGGVVGIAYLAPFLRAEAAATFERLWAGHARRVRSDRSASSSVVYDRLATTPLEVTLTDVCDHILHAVDLVGPKHVALGSDWDGTFNLPPELRSAAGLPRLAKALRQRGLPERDVREVMGGSLMRVLRAVRG